MVRYTKNSERRLVAVPSASRSLLKGKRWVWFCDVVCNGRDEEYVFEMTRAAFSVLYESRLNDGFMHTTDLSSSISMFKELEVHGTRMGVQYILLYEPMEKRLMTEVWIEPIHEVLPELDLLFKCFYDKALVFN
jgi:hypothetical protein